MKKPLLFLSVIFGVTLFSGTAQAVLPAPYDFQANWGSGGSGYGLHNQNMQFNYDSSVISQVKALRFYQKKPGALSFSEVATFNNPSSIYRDCSAQALTQESLNGYMTVGTWQLVHLCGQAPQEYWALNPTGPLSPASAFPPGQYDFYIAVLDASGGEAAVSPIASQYVLEQTKILSPAPGDSPSDVTALRWTVPSGWLGDFAHYAVEIYEGTAPGGSAGPVYVSGLLEIGQANTIGEFSQSYTGPKLNPAKIYTIVIEGSYTYGKELPNPKNPTGSPHRSYISMNMPVKIEAPPRALNIRVGQVTDSSAHVIWDSNVPAVSSVDYRKFISGNSGGAVTAWTSTFKTSHDVLLKGLTPNTTYYFSIRLKNALQSEVATELYEKNSFTTLALPPLPPPPVLKPVPPPSPPAPKPAPAPVVKPAPAPPPTIESKEEKQVEKLPPSVEEQKSRGIFRRFIDSIKTFWRGLFS